MHLATLVILLWLTVLNMNDPSLGGVVLSPGTPSTDQYEGAVDSLYVQDTPVKPDSCRERNL